MPRVLFVDDEVGVLQGLQRMLFEMDDWDMLFVDSGERALVALRDARFDVIVSDMRMPGMDGAMLLSRAHAEHPEVVRIILTGHSELEATFRAMPVAHSFLTKPCKPGVVQQVIGQCCALGRLLQRDDQRTLAGRIVALPVQPLVHSRLLEAVADPRTDPAELAKLVRADVGLSSKVLHLTNSAFFGAPCNFVSVDRAMSYIGPSMFRRLVGSGRVFGGGSQGLDAAWLDAEQRHALASANLAALIAPRDELRDQAFLAGFLHGVGRLVWAVASQGPQAPAAEAVAGEVAAPGADVRSAAVDAAQAAKPSPAWVARLGAYLLGLWGLAPDVVDAVAYHRDPASARGVALELATAVHVADGLARACDDERAGQTAEHSIDVEHLERMGKLGKLDEWRQMSRTARDRESA